MEFLLYFDYYLQSKGGSVEATPEETRTPGDDVAVSLLCVLLLDIFVL